MFCAFTMALLSVAVHLRVQMALMLRVLGTSRQTPPQRLSRLTIVVQATPLALPLMVLLHALSASTALVRLPFLVKTLQERGALASLAMLQLQHQPAAQPLLQMSAAR
jgi:hypothetical protein